ncbi:hypothetical protein OGAPHI_006734 [Ogataea philodendri]|uniref:N-acetyltransferase domain-containing protein n=1 Tax=Ogataea philodendri TaxID=1378263 RepID=A0A9P8NXM8_9ASCO|nr:uncharacterized protein OGAPHI_006734 [Ogataea philodendri]KAH3661327.1 hypothetical protein OGAPHI_006734 [Ogataea philodendri]
MSKLAVIPVTLRNGSAATIVPFESVDQVPKSLVNEMRKEYNLEVEQGNTLSQIEPLSEQEFLDYYCPKFLAILVDGEFKSTKEVADFAKTQDVGSKFLGSYYIKPNYPGRSGHNCNAGFLVSSKTRGLGIGKILGKSYLEYAPKLGYRYSVFNLVYETNQASARIWDQLGFERIGRVKGAGNLKDHGYTDAIIFGYDFTKKTE